MVKVVRRESVLEIKKQVYLDGIMYLDHEGVGRAFSRNRSDLKQMIDSADETTGRIVINSENNEIGHIQEVIYASSSGRRAAVVTLPWKTYVEKGKPDTLEGITHYYVLEQNLA